MQKVQLIKKRPINDVNNGKTTVTVSQVHDRNTGLQSEQPSFIAVAIGSVIKLFPRLFQIVMSQCVEKMQQMEICLQFKIY